MDIYSWHVRELWGSLFPCDILCSQCREYITFHVHCTGVQSACTLSVQRMYTSVPGNTLSSEETSTRSTPVIITLREHEKVRFNFSIILSPSVHLQFMRSISEVYKQQLGIWIWSNVRCELMSEMTGTCVNTWQTLSPNLRRGRWDPIFLSSLETQKTSCVYKPGPFMIPQKEGNMHIGTSLTVLPWSSRQLFRQKTPRPHNIGSWWPPSFLIQKTNWKIW